MFGTAAQNGIGAARRLLQALTLAFVAASSGWSQQDRITTSIDPNQVVVLKGSVRPQARPQYDQGPVASSFQLPYITMMLKPSAAQQAALLQLLAAQHDSASSEYRHWLNPEEYAGRFGASRNDIGKIHAWLRSAGFKLEYTARGRDWIAFSGTAAQVRSVLRTEVHHYVVNGEAHFAISVDASIPAALGPLVAALTGLDDFNPKPPTRLRPANTNRYGTHALAPGDLATIYDINQLYGQGFDGTGQMIVIVGQTRLVLSDIPSFRSYFGLGSQNIQMIETGPDPGTDLDPIGEADLDLELAGSIARNASFMYVYSTDATGAAVYAIDQNLAPVISESFGTCEANVPSSLASAYETEAQKANSLGITWLASSGDQGAAGCDNGATVAYLGLAVNFPASIPEVTGVGGTEFNEGAGNYWSVSNLAFGGSALSYIPEIAWNDTAFGDGLAASGGGASILYSKPSWQTGPGVANDNARDVPDIAMDSSNDHDPYLVYTGGQWQLVGGTSAAAPVLAGIVALLNQRLNANGEPGVGNINTVLYKMAQSSPSAFHDIVAGNNIVPCAIGTPNCNSGEFGYSAGPGYDLVTGLGTVDAYNLAINWPGEPVGQVTLVSLLPASATVGGPGFTLTVNGLNFATGVAVNWAGTNLSTTFVSSTKLQAFVSPTLIAQAGTAAVSVSSGGNLSNTVSFNTTPVPLALDLIDPRLTVVAPAAGGCVLPPSQTTFPTSNNFVYLYFAAIVTDQDILSNDWLAPDGTTVPGVSWGPQAGDVCFTGASLEIGGLTGAKLGSWQVRIYDNGKLLTSVPFYVSAAPSPGPVITAVKNAASYASGTVSVGEIVVIFGWGMGPDQLVGLTLNSAGLVSTSAGGTTVQFNGIAAPMIYSFASQVSAIVPYELTGATAQVTVSYQGQTSAAFPVTVASAVPGLFTANSSGSGQVAALNQDNTLNSVAQPAAQESTIVLFATGEGQTSPPGVDGKLAAAPLPQPLQNVTVTIGDVPATVRYAGGAPGEVAGVLQVNASIPPGVFGSSVPIIVQVGNASSQAGATIEVAPNPVQPAFTVLTTETTASVYSDSNGGLNCVAPTPQMSFQSTIPDAWVYFTYQNAQQGDVLQFNWVHPSGTVDPSQPVITLSSGGPGCAAEPLAIDGAEAASELGNWQVRVSRNNVLQFTLTFSIVSATPPFAVVAKETAGALITDSNGNPLYCAVPPAKTNFLTTDPFVWVWFKFNGANRLDSFTLDWTHPSGKVEVGQGTTLDFSGSGCAAMALAINGAEAATEFGNWQVQVFRNGASVFVLPFTIQQPPFGFYSQMTTLEGSNSVSNGSNETCQIPLAQQAFLTTNPYVFVWYAFYNVQNGDTLSAKWIGPGGVTDVSQPVTVGFNGLGCASFGWETGAPGDWKVEAFRNGGLLFTLPFTVFQN